MTYIPDPTDATNPTDAIAAETAAPEFRALKAYIQSIVGGTNVVGGGFVNKFRNGAFDVAQRGPVTIATTSSQYTLDGWIVTPTGANVVVSQQATNGLAKSGRGGGKVLQIAPAGALTQLAVQQRIESFNIDELQDGINNITAQIAAYYIGTGNLFATIQVQAPTAADNFGATTAIVTSGGLQTIIPNQWNVLAYTFAPNSAMINGALIEFDFGALSSNLQLAFADIRSTPGLLTGTQLAPPRPEVKSIAYEAADARRYYNGYSKHSSGTEIIGTAIAQSTAIVNIILPLMSAMRVNPANTFNISTASDFAIMTGTGGLFSIVSMSPSSILTESETVYTLFAALSGAVITAGNPYFFALNGSGSFLGFGSEL